VHPLEPRSQPRGCRERSPVLISVTIQVILDGGGAQGARDPGSVPVTFQSPP
jgi:hypothetical protein